jgi:hypothetical protein
VENNPITSTDPDGHACQNGSSNCPSDEAKNDQEDSKKAKDDAAIRAHAKELLDQAWGALTTGVQFGGGFVKGVVASASWGSIESADPQPTDTPAERAGEIAGNATVGGVGISLAVNGGGAAAGTVWACLGGATCAIPATAAAAAALGTAMAGGAAKEAAALITTPIESRRQGDFTPGTKDEIDTQNAQRHGGQNACDRCGKPVQKIANKKGVPTPNNQLQRHHKKWLSNGGKSTSKNAEVLCPPCHISEHR